MKEFSRDIADGNRTLYLYGFVEYETMGIGWHRDFGYRWKIFEDAREPPDPRSIVFQDPGNSGTFCVTGWWEKDLCRPNKEYRQQPN
jgi:hypothetical protein